MDCELLKHVEEIHTTPMGIDRIRRNMKLEDEDVVAWCIEQMKLSQARISRMGKNWYVDTNECRITVNAYSYTIITVHKQKNK